MNEKTKKWIKAALVRAVRTTAQCASTMLVIGAFNENAWSILIQTSLLTGVASLLTSIGGLPEVEV